MTTSLLLGGVLIVVSVGVIASGSRVREPMTAPEPGLAASTATT